MKDGTNRSTPSFWTRTSFVMPWKLRWKKGETSSTSTPATFSRSTGSTWSLCSGRKRAHFSTDSKPGGTARRRLGRMWSARSCRWCWRRLRRRTPRKRCTKSRAIASRSSSPTSSGWCNGWTTGDVTTTRAHDTNCEFRILLCTCIERRSCLCLYLPVVLVEYISGYLDFIASHTTAVVDTREGM